MDNPQQPVFPHTARQRVSEDGAHWTVEVYHPGLSHRDYFAAKAMQAMCGGAHWPDPSDYGTIARRAYAMADEMLKAREENFNE